MSSDILKQVSGTRIVKKSGRPLDPEDKLKYEEDWRITYDKAEKKCGTNMLKLQRMLQYAQFLLYKKYYKDNFVTDFNHLREIIIEQNYTPITFGVTESGELVAIVQDI